MCLKKLAFPLWLCCQFSCNFPGPWYKTESLAKFLVLFMPQLKKIRTENGELSSAATAVVKQLFFANFFCIDTNPGEMILLDAWHLTVNKGFWHNYKSRWITSCFLPSIWHWKAAFGSVDESYAHWEEYRLFNFLVVQKTVCTTVFVR